MPSRSMRISISETRSLTSGGEPLTGSSLGRLRYLTSAGGFPSAAASTRWPPLGLRVQLHYSLVTVGEDLPSGDTHRGLPAVIPAFDPGEPPTTYRGTSLKSPQHSQD